MNNEEIKRTHRGQAGSGRRAAGRDCRRRDRIVRAGGLAISAVGEISGDLVITDESGARQAVVAATLEYSQTTKEGTAHLAIWPRRREGRGGQRPAEG